MGPEVILCLPLPYPFHSYGLQTELSSSKQSTALCPCGCTMTPGGTELAHYAVAPSTSGSGRPLALKMPELPDHLHRCSSQGTAPRPM